MKRTNPVSSDRGKDAVQVNTAWIPHPLNSSPSAQQIEVRSPDLESWSSPSPIRGSHLSPDEPSSSSEGFSDSCSRLRGTGDLGYREKELEIHRVTPYVVLMKWVNSLVTRPWRGFLHIVGWRRMIGVATKTSRVFGPRGQHSSPDPGRTLEGPWKDRNPSF